MERASGTPVTLVLWSGFSFGVGWPQGLLDAMIAKADGDSALPGSTAPQCAPSYVQALGFPSAWTSAGWFEGWLPKSVLSLGNGLSSVEAWFSTSLDIEEVFSGTGGDQLHVMVADVIKSFDTVDRSILDRVLERLGPDLFRKAVFFFS